MRPERLFRGFERLVTPKKYSYHLPAEVLEHFDRIAERWDDYKRSWRYYHRERHRFIRSIVADGASVLEVGCATGQLLASLHGGRRVGTDVSPRMIEVARGRHPDLELHAGPLETLPELGTFDYVLLDNLVEYLGEIHPVLRELRHFAHRHTKLVLTANNPVWSAFISLAHMLGTGTPDIQRNFTSNLDLVNLLQLTGWDVIESGWRLALPVGVPLLAPAVNAVVPRLPMLRGLCMIEYVVARPRMPPDDALSAAVVIPCFNEEENVGEAIDRTAGQPGVAEIIVVDDGSTDRTAEVARGRMATVPQLRVVSYRPNEGKAAAVRRGFAAATADIVMILDADMTVAPEEVPNFIEPIRSGQAEFVNGTRLVYPMNRAAMKLANYLGNKFFGIVLSLIMGQRNTDTLCGTKAFLRRWLPHMTLGGAGWGDFDLLFSAARLKLKMVEWPLRYADRQRGASKMHPLREFAAMLRTCWRGLREIP